MKKTLAIIITVILALSSQGQTSKPNITTGQVPDLKWAAKAGAKKIPHRKKVLNVSSFGARNDGTTLNTKPIQTARDECASK